jgi:hypothetical protein
VEGEPGTRATSKKGERKNKEQEIKKVKGREKE